MEKICVLQINNKRKGERSDEMCSVFFVKVDLKADDPFLFPPSAGCKGH